MKTNAFLISLRTAAVHAKHKINLHGDDKQLKKVAIKQLLRKKEKPSAVSTISTTFLLLILSL